MLALGSRELPSGRDPRRPRCEHLGPGPPAGAAAVLPRPCQTRCWPSCTDPGWGQREGGRPALICRGSAPPEGVLSHRTSGGGATGTAPSRECVPAGSLAGRHSQWATTWASGTQRTFWRSSVHAFARGWWSLWAEVLLWSPLSTSCFGGPSRACNPSSPRLGPVYLVRSLGIRALPWAQL